MITRYYGQHIMYIGFFAFPLIYEYSVSYNYYANNKDKI